MGHPLHLSRVGRRRALRLIHEHRDSRGALYRRYRDGEKGPPICPRCGSRERKRLGRTKFNRSLTCVDCGRSGMMEAAIRRIRRDLREHGETDDIRLVLAANYIQGLRERRGERSKPILRKDPL